MKTSKIISQNIGFLLVIFYIILACIFFYLVVNPLQDTKDIWIGADTQTYVEYSKTFSDNQELFSVSSNYFGPIMILRIVNNNYDLILFINCFLFLFSYLLINKNYRINELKFTLLLLMNPMVFISLVSINKEVFGLFSISLLSCFLKSNNIKYYIISLISSFFVRWQQFILVILILFMVKIYKYRNHKVLNLFLVIMILSVTYPLFLSSIFDQIVDFDTISSQKDKLGGINILLNDLQSRYMFFIAVIPKILFNYFGNIVRVFTFPIEILKLLTEPEKFDIENIYNTYIIVGHQISMLILLFIFLRNFIQNELKLNKISDNIFLIGLYSILYSLSSIIQYRYFFPIYILLCLEISRKKYSTNK